MIERYAVSRASLREALRILEVHGLISVKPGPGGGPRVGGSSQVNFGKMTSSYLQMLGATYQELLQARLHIEPFMARLAAVHRTDAQCDQLDRLARGHDRHMSDDLVHIRENLDFHTLVGEMSGNRILDLMAGGLRAIFVTRVPIPGYILPPEERPKTLSEHEAIAKAIRRGKPQEAERLMLAHMQDYLDHASGAYPGFEFETVGWA